MEVKAIMMNFMDNMEEMAKKGAKDSREEPRAQTSIESTVLAMIQIALAADFARFQSLNKAKMLLEDLKSKVDLQSRTLTRSASLPLHKNSKIGLSSNPKKSTQKSQPSKSVAPTRQSDPRTSTPKLSPVQATSKSINTTFSETTSKSVCCKGKKKIHKNLEERRGNPKRMMEPSLITTAQIPRMRLGQKEKRRLRRLLLQREMVPWTHHDDHRKQGRELRNQH